MNGVVKGTEGVVDLGTVLTAHQSLTNYYTKSQTSSVAQLTAAFNNKAAKATTLAGYGITDAKIASGVITLGSNSITPLTAHQSLTAYETKADLTANYYKKTQVSSAAQVKTAFDNKVKVGKYDSGYNLKSTDLCVVNINAEDYY